jgi:hypothetical protein
MLGLSVAAQLNILSVRHLHFRLQNDMSKNQVYIGEDLNGTIYWLYFFVRITCENCIRPSTCPSKHANHLTGMQQKYCLCIPLGSNDLGTLC